MPRSSSILNWLRAARPKTLPAAIVPVAVGTALGTALTGEWFPGLATLTLLCCLGFQIATNFFNDAIDFKKGADTSRRVGPVRVTASGLISPRAVMSGALLILFATILLAIPLIQARGWIIIAIGLPSLFLCYSYTGGPFPLAYLGLGELFVFLFFGWVAVVGSFFVQAGSMTLPAFLAGSQVGLLSCVLIAINNFRDHEEDRESGKRTLAVRRGPTFARREIALFLFLPYLVGLGWVSERPFAFWIPLAALPIAIILQRKIARTEPGPVYNRFLGLSAVHLLLFSAALIAGFFVASVPKIG